jgi:hypothetical protein
MNLSTRSSFGFLGRIHVKPGTAFVVIMLVALIAFEMFNYSTTDYALNDLLGTLKFLGIPWSTILAIAFCGIDFAGIARLFTPEQGSDEPKEVWYLLGAWLLAATMNAILTWWGVSMAIATHPVRSTAVVDPNTLTKVVPIFVAVMVWVIRVLIIGTLSVTGDRLLNHDRRSSYPANRGRQAYPGAQASAPSMSTAQAMAARPSLARAAAAPRPAPIPEGSNRSVAEPTYQSVNAPLPPLGSRPAVRAMPAADSGTERRM